MTHNQPEGDHNRERTESKAERAERRADNRGRGEAAQELNSGKLNEKQHEQKAAGEGNRKLTPKELEIAAHRGQLVLGLGTIAQGGRIELVERKPDGTETTLIHGLKGEQVKALTELAANAKPVLPFDVNAPVGTAKHSFPESQTSDPLVVGHKPQVPGAVDGPKKPDAQPDHFRELRAGAVELLKADVGVLHGTVNFAVNTIAGLGDLVRMGAAAHRELSGLDLLIKDPDPEGTKKLHEACAGLSVASRVLLQYNTTFNPESRLYGVNFDPAGNEMALKLAESMPARIVQEIDQFGKSDTEAKSAKATELLLNIATLAAGGEGLAAKGGELSKLGTVAMSGEELSGPAKAGQLASESKLLPNILQSMTEDMHAFISQIKQLPKSKHFEQITQTLEQMLFPQQERWVTAGGPQLGHVQPSPKGDNLFAMSKGDDLGGVNRPKDVQSGKTEKPPEVKQEALDSPEELAKFAKQFGISMPPKDTYVFAGEKDAISAKAAAERLGVTPEELSTWDESKLVAAGAEKIPDYRDAFFNTHPGLIPMADRIVVHHGLPKWLLKEHQGLFSAKELNDPSVLRGVYREVNDEMHNKEIHTSWIKFQNKNPNPSRNDVLKKLKEIDAEFGSFFVPMEGE